MENYKKKINECYINDIIHDVYVGNRYCTVRNYDEYKLS